MMMKILKLIGIYVVGITVCSLLAMQVAGMMYFLFIGLDPADVRPLTIIQSYEYFWKFNKQKLLLLAASLIPLTATYLVLYFFFGSNNKTNKKPFGHARWATEPEIKQANLRDNAGIVLGRKKGKLLVSNKPTHVLLTAPTGAGKGVGVVIPNLLYWQGSVVVLDIKQENHQITSGYRRRLGETFLFSPMESRSHCYNPLDFVRSNPSDSITDIQQIAQFLVPSNNDSDQMWTSEARNLFLGIALYVLNNKDVPSTIGEIFRTLNSNIALGELCKHLSETWRDKLPPACIMALSNFANKAEKEQSGVKSSLTAALNLWANPTIDSATSFSDFNIERLRNSRQSIYVGVTFSQIHTLRPLLSLFFQQTIDVLSRNIPKEDEPHKVLILIDEFPALGKMPVISESLPVMRGYNIRMLNVCQGLSYLDKHYGREGREGFLQNSGYQLFFAPNDEVTTKFISDKMGQDTIQVEGTGSSRQQARGIESTRKNLSNNQSHTARPFMLPQETRLVDNKTSFLFIENALPVKAEILRYYADKEFKDKVMPPSHVPMLAIEVRNPPHFDINDDSKESKQTLPPKSTKGYEIV